eukprot:gi/632990209/ref/XP_007884061.1/ PREDICTED: platelet glycoprotein VI-like [Callorhinchus milii]
MPSSPSLEYTRGLGTLVRGDTLKLTCWAPAFHPGVSFALHRDGQRLSDMGARATAPAHTHTVTFSLPGVSPDHAGHYTCSYRVRRDNKDVWSEQSNSVRVTIIEQPPKARLEILRQPPVFSLGETVSLRCEAPLFYEGLVFALYRGAPDGRGRTRTLTRRTAGYSVRFTLEQVSRAEQGLYSCVYSVSRAARFIDSRPSDTMELTITGTAPPAPTAPDSARQRPPEPDSARESPTEPDSARQRPTEPDRARQRPTAPASARQSPTAPDRARQRPTAPARAQQRPPEPDRARPRPPEPTRARQSPREPDSARQSPPEPDRARESPTAPDRARQSPTEPDRAGQRPTEPARARQRPPEPD